MQDRREYMRNYQKAHITHKKVAFNDQSPQDMALLDWVELQQNFSAYCKNLIRADMREKSPGRFRPDE